MVHVNWTIEKIYRFNHTDPQRFTLLLPYGDPIWITFPFVQECYRIKNAWNIWKNEPVWKGEETDVGKANVDSFYGELNKEWEDLHKSDSSDPKGNGSIK